MGLRRRQTVTEAPVMKTELIRPFESLLARETSEGSPLVSAVLFGSGKLVEVSESNHVFGLIVAGYEGLLFGDDGTFTARVASELPVERYDGVRKLETYINDAVQSINSAYVAEHVGFCPADEAAVYIRALTKKAHGEFVPHSELAWSDGFLALDQPSPPTDTNVLIL